MNAADFWREFGQEQPRTDHPTPLRCSAEGCYEPATARYGGERCEAHPFEAARPKGATCRQGHPRSVYSYLVLINGRERWQCRICRRRLNELHGKRYIQRLTGAAA